MLRHMRGSSFDLNNTAHSPAENGDPNNPYHTVTFTEGVLHRYVNEIRDAVTRHV